ncbi:MAG: M20/M25/M40 family metallo-hydrolase [Candidatus Omnitrophota bacterium]
MTSIKSILSIALAVIFITSSISAEEAMLKSHVKALSSDIGKRNLTYYQNLELAAGYVRREFRKYGYEPQEETYYIPSGPYRNLPLTNIIAVKEGAAQKNKVIVIGAHYDTFQDAPGADDNTTGVAAVLELARLLRNADINSTVKFIIFPNEETDLVYKDNEMGSYRYAQGARQRGEDIEAMICIDMIGYYSDEPGSQKYPLALKPFYPDKGNFVGICGDFGSYDLVKKTVAEFKKNCDVPSEYMIAPASFLPQIMQSDHRSFWTFGYSAVWITDTCIYRNPYMHSRNDLYDTLDYKRMSKVVDCIYRLVLNLGK